MKSYYKIPVKHARLNWDSTVQRISELPGDSILVIFGAGLSGIPLYYRLKELGIEVSYFCDNDNTKQNKQYCGKTIISPDKLLENKEKYYVLIGADCYADEIQKGICGRGFPSDHIVTIREDQNVDLVIPKETLGNRTDLETTNFRFPQVSKMETPLVTVRTKFYNEPIYYVQRNIESILSQTFTAFDLVIIENGATEEICELVAKYAALDKRIKIIYSKENKRGSFDPEYKTKYFCRIDGDDYYGSTFLKRAVGAAELYDADIVAVNSIWYEENAPEKIKYTSALHMSDIVLHGASEVVDSAIEHLPIFSSSWAKLVKTSFYFLNMDTTVSNIPDSIVKYFSKANAMVIIPEILHYWTQRGRSVTNSAVCLWDNWRNISCYRVLERINLAFVEEAVNSGAYSERNDLVLKQNLMTQLRSYILPQLQANSSFQTDVVLKIVHEILEENFVTNSLTCFPEYEQFINDLLTLESTLKGEKI